MRLKAIILAAAFLFVASTGMVMAKSQGAPGAVYTATNAAAGNAVLVFNRSADGSLSPAGSYPTGGSGTGGGLGNQGGVILSPDNQWLYVVNAGSDDISVFKVKPNGLEKVGDPIPSGGELPVSLTVDGDLLYVLNAGGTVGGSDNISGFIVGQDGTLSPLDGSTQPLSRTDTSPAQIEFSTDGNVLVVTEKGITEEGTYNIDTYVVDNDGKADPPVTFTSAGDTPFGFSFSKRNRLYVSEAGTSSASSYQVNPDGDLVVISAAVPINQDGVCWLEATKNGRYAYTTNAVSGTIGVLNIDRDGTLSLLDIADAIGGVVDEALSNDSRYLYALSSGAGKIIGFKVGSDGGLIPLPNQVADSVKGIQVSGLPSSTNGLAAH